MQGTVRWEVQAGWRGAADVQVGAAKQKMTNEMAGEVVGSGPGGSDGVPGAEGAAAESDAQRRGRVRANGRLTAAGIGEQSEFAKQQRTPMEKGEHRRSRAVHEVAAAGTRDLNDFKVDGRPHAAIQGWRSGVDFQPPPERMLSFLLVLVGFGEGAGVFEEFHQSA